MNHSSVATLVPRVSLAAALALAAAPSALAAPVEPILSQTPNLDRPTTTPTGEVDFLFTHRFSVTSGKVSNSPTFDLATGLAPSLEARLRYATNSDVGSGFNEWEPSLHYGFLSAESTFRLGLTAAYNSNAVSGDGALQAAYDLGPVTLLGNARGFSSGFGVGGPTVAVGAGAIWHLNRLVALSADYNGVVAGQNMQAIANQTGNLVPAWSAALQFAIPYSPHVVSFYVTNANTRTLEGESRGSSQLRGGFEFLIPFRDLARWQALVSPPEVAPAHPASLHPSASIEAPAASTADVVIEQFKYGPADITVARGTTVRWSNHDAMQHSATADDGSFDTGLIDSGRSATYTFQQPGDYPYHCTPHPFMKGTIHVR